MIFSVDLISDLCLTYHDNFDWSGKSSSLICIIAGNISDDFNIIEKTLMHLSTCYKGIMYIDSRQEHSNILEYNKNIEKLSNSCSKIPNVIYLHDNIVVLDHIAFIGINGWYHNGHASKNEDENFWVDYYKNDDIAYLANSIKHLQDKPEIKKIIIVSGSVPNANMLFHNTDSYKDTEPGMTLVMDVNNKVSHWLYGGNTISVDQIFNFRRFVNNPKTELQPYWPKTIFI